MDEATIKVKYNEIKYNPHFVIETNDSLIQYPVSALSLEEAEHYSKWLSECFMKHWKSEVAKLHNSGQ